jgi:uncharacterized protein
MQKQRKVSIMRAVRALAVVLLVAIAGERLRAEDAPSPEALQAANELFAILSPDMVQQLSTQMTGLAWPALEKAARADNIDDATLAELRQELERIQAKNVADLMKEAPAIYARHFTVGELHDLITFYHSSTGLKAMRELPEVTGELVVAVAPRLQDLQRQAAERFGEILRAHGYVK